MIEVRSVRGGALKDVLPDLARLRMEVFREWPYLYDGSLDYEQDYLSKFSEAAGAVCVVAFDGDRVIGASTGLPLGEEHDEFISPFLKAGYDVSQIFYCGESVLLQEYRGQGIGHQFFDLREAQAKILGGFTHSTFCRVLRPKLHPLKPENYFELDGFWEKRGYKPVTGLVAHYEWRELNQPEETKHQLQFWMKDIS